MILVVKVVIYDPELVISEVLTVIWLLYLDIDQPLKCKNTLNHFDANHSTFLNHLIGLDLDEIRAVAYANVFQIALILPLLSTRSLLIPDAEFMFIAEMS